MLSFQQHNSISQFGFAKCYSLNLVSQNNMDSLHYIIPATCVSLHWQFWNYIHFCMSRINPSNKNRFAYQTLHSCIIIVLLCSHSLRFILYHRSEWTESDSVDVKHNTMLNCNGMLNTQIYKSSFANDTECFQMKLNLKSETRTQNNNNKN